VSRDAIAAHGAVHFDCARLSADHERLYYNDRVGNRSLVRMRRVSTGEVVWEADSGPDVAFAAMELTPDERFIVTSTGYQDSRITVRHALTGQIVTELKGHTRWVCWLAFSPDGQLLASTSSDQTIRLWDTATWTPSGVFRGHGDEVETVAFSPDGKLLASGCKDGAVLLWNTRDAKTSTGQIALSKRVHLAWPLEEAHSVLAMNTDRGWSIIDLPTKHEVPLPIDPTHPTCLFAPNILGVFNGTDRLTLNKVTSSGLAPMGEIPVRGRFTGAFAYHPGRKLVAWGNGSKILHVTSLDDPTRSQQLGPAKATIVPVSFTPDGVYLRARVGSDLAYWNVSTGAPAPFPASDQTYTDYRLDRVAPPNRPIVMDALREYHPWGGISGIAFSPDEATLAISAQSGWVAVYDFANPKNYNVLQGHMGAVHGVTFSPDGKRLVTTGGGDELAKVWDVETRQELLTLGGSGSLISVVTFSPDGNTLVVGSRAQAGSAQYWIAPSWEEIARAEQAEAASGSVR
jgi:WD40 repeat protein